MNKSCLGRGVFLRAQFLCQPRIVGRQRPETMGRRL